jgi:hypothetical protein
VTKARRQQLAIALSAIGAGLFVAATAMLAPVLGVATAGVVCFATGMLLLEVKR